LSYRPDKTDLTIHQKMLRAWDPDYTKLTADEETALQAAEDSGFLSESEIDWDHLDRIA